MKKTRELIDNGKKIIHVNYTLEERQKIYNEYMDSLRKQAEDYKKSLSCTEPDIPAPIEDPIGLDESLSADTPAED